MCFLLTKGFWRLSPGPIHWKSENLCYGPMGQSEVGTIWAPQHGNYFVSQLGIISQTWHFQTLHQWSYSPVMSLRMSDLNCSWCVFKNLPLFFHWIVIMWPFLENSVINIKVVFPHVFQCSLYNVLMGDPHLTRSWIVTWQHASIWKEKKKWHFQLGYCNRHVPICLLQHYQRYAEVLMASSNRKDLQSCSWIVEPPYRIMLNTIMQTYFFNEYNTK